MAKFLMSAYEAKDNGNGRFAIVFNIGKGDPFPGKVVEAKNTAEALAAFDAYVAEAKASGMLLGCSLRIKDGERKPNGFDKARQALGPYTIVNGGN